MISERHDTLLYFVPHQDDELLTMGIDICDSLLHKKDVHVILCTDGSKSGIIKQLNDQQDCPNHAGNHIYDLSESEFSAARDEEFKESCLALGVAEDNIHILPQRAVDGSLTADFAESVICRFLELYGKQSVVCTIYHDNDEMQHHDHKALGFAAANLFEAGKIRKVRFFCEPYHLKENDNRFTKKRASKDVYSKIEGALNSYAYWNPPQKRYAIGYHSVTKEMDRLRQEMTCYFFGATRDK